MRLKKEYFLIFVALLISISCSTTSQKQISSIAVSVETPNCPTSKCRLRYSTSSQIYDATPPLPIVLSQQDADLYVACYDDRSEGKIQSIIVKGRGYRKIIHPLDCSFEAGNLETTESKQTEDYKTEILLKNETEAQADESIKTLDKSGSDKDDDKFETGEENLAIVSKEAQEELENKEKLAKELMEQIDSLYKQGLITKEIYEKEKAIILNITK
tara:strand:+ start:520 stop:1164 length:645 start_codon:yes stop_codon:yes gene_type:complete